MKRTKRIFCVVAYDVSDDKRRAGITKLLEKYGVRVNLSVFECMFTPVQFLKIQEAIGQLICGREDTVIYYPLCMECFAKIVRLPKRKEYITNVYMADSEV